MYLKINCTLQYFPDRFVRKEVNKLPIRCPNTDKGCLWNGVLGELENHLQKCSFGYKPCQHCKELMPTQQVHYPCMMTQQKFGIQTCKSKFRENYFVYTVSVVCLSCSITCCLLFVDPQPSRVLPYEETTLSLL